MRALRAPGVRHAARVAASVAVLCLVASRSAEGQPRLTLSQVVTPASQFVRDGQPVKFALHGFIELSSVDELLSYIDLQAGRWTFPSPAARQAYAESLLRKGVESRLVSMAYEPPLEALTTHTAQELSTAVDLVHTTDDPLIYKGQNWQLTRQAYRAVLIAIQTRWKSSLNCWSAAPSIPARVLSNWYPITEGIELYGASYDSTEHFWQAVKYHPAVTVAEVLDLVDQLAEVDWTEWLQALDRDQSVYLGNTYAVEFLRANLAASKLAWFDAELRKRVTDPSAGARAVQQRDPAGPRFAALDEKILWGDLADTLHLIYFFTKLDDGRFRTPRTEPVVTAIIAKHFDGIYLDEASAPRGFISPEFRRLMLEIWRVKFLKMRRFGDVIRSIRGVKLDHFLNDGDSPDIPIPIYVGYLNRIRALAMQQAAR